MFEQQYKRANDRIHPRADLLQELEAKWAAEEAREPEERGRIVPFPVWARVASVAAGVLLCVGVGMGSVLLYARSRGIEKSASADMKMTASGAVAAQEEAYIITESKLETAAEDAALPPEAMLMTSLAAAPAQGMHPARDEAEVEEAVLYADRGAAEMETDREAEAPAAKAVTAVQGVRYPAGYLRQRDDLVAVFMPTTEQVHIIRYANRKVTSAFALNLREKGAQAQQVLWLEDQMVAVQEKDGEVRLIRTDVSSYDAPRHLKNLTQSGTCLTAAEMGGKVFTLSLYEAGEEPWPWVNGQRMDYADILVDGDRPGGVFTVITVYDPRAGDGFAAQTALLAEARGAIVETDRLLLWAGEEESALYVFAWDQEGLTLTAEDVRPGTVLDAGLVGEDFEILMQQGEDVVLLTVDRDLHEVRSAAAQGVGTARFAAVYEEGSVVLTATGFHWLSGAGDADLETAADAFTWLAPDRGLLISADGKLQLVDMMGSEPVLRGTVQLRDSLALLVEDPSRLAFDLETERLAFPAGQKVYQYQINDKGEFIQRGAPLSFGDHSETEQRELRVLYAGDRTLVFYKNGVVLCNQILEKQLTHKY